MIRQGAEQKYKPVLYVERNPSVHAGGTRGRAHRGGRPSAGEVARRRRASRGRSLRRRGAGEVRRRPRVALRAGDVGLPALSPRRQAARVGGAEHAREVRHDHGGVSDEPANSSCHLRHPERSEASASSRASGARPLSSRASGASRGICTSCHPERAQRVEGSAPYCHLRATDVLVSGAYARRTQPACAPSVLRRR